MNRARQDPDREGQRLAGITTGSVANAYRHFRVNRRRLKRQFRKIEPAPPAAFNRQLYEAALAHAERLSNRGGQHHRGQIKKISKSGFPLQQCAGSVYSHAVDATHAHAAFAVDWGRGWGGTQFKAGHRKALMSVEATLDETGIAVISSNRKSQGPLIVVANYCQRLQTSRPFRRFVVGTVYVDRNGNSEFDVDEGVGGVRIQSSIDRRFVVSAAGGGYALPLDDTGPGIIEFSHQSFGRHTADIHASSVNVLVDLKLR